jgi:hypothetical protein
MYYKANKGDWTMRRLLPAVLCLSLRLTLGGRADATVRAAATPRKLRG